MTNILFDKDGLVVKRELDGSLGYGDCAAETFRYFHLCHIWNIVAGPDSSFPTYEMLKSYTKHAYNVLCQSPGVLMRGPKGTLPEEWGDPAKDFSADQTDPAIICLGNFGLYEELAEVYAAQKKRYFFYQNGDLPRLHTFNLYRRAFGQEPRTLYDSSLYVTAMTRCGMLPFWDSGLKKLMLGNPDDVADDLNFLHYIMQSISNKQTSISKKAWHLYKNKRIASNGTLKLGEPNHILGAVKWYYRVDNTGLFAMYKTVIEHMIKHF